MRKIEIEANEAFEEHKKAMPFDSWIYGPIRNAWHDEYGILCIEYESGDWWHYKKSNNEIVWW